MEKAVQELESIDFYTINFLVCWLIHNNNFFQVGQSLDDEVQKGWGQCHLPSEKEELSFHFCVGKDAGKAIEKHKRIRWEMDEHRNLELWFPLL